MRDCGNTLAVGTMEMQSVSRRRKPLSALAYVVFFFSSRRRHTRFDCDWSSDVCSSDLLADSVRRFIRKDYDFESRRKIVASAEGWSGKVWGTFAEMGLLGLPFSPDYGGDRKSVV